MEVDEMQAEIEELKRAQGLLDDEMRAKSVLDSNNKS